MNAYILSALILGAVGLPLILAGILVLAARKKKRMRCTYETTAVITGNRRYRSKGEHGYRHMYHGIYEYTFRGETYQKQSYVGTSFRAKEGKEKTAYVNPDRPQECIIEGWVSALAVGLLLGFGALMEVLALVFVFVGRM